MADFSMCTIYLYANHVPFNLLTNIPDITGSIGAYFMQLTVCDLIFILGCSYAFPHNILRCCVCCLIVPSCYLLKSCNKAVLTFEFRPSTVFLVLLI